jgi:hypothetical protein
MNQTQLCIPSPIVSRFHLHTCLLHRTHFTHAMASKTEQTLLTTGNVIVDDAKTASRAESGIAVTSSTSNAAVEKMVKKDIPMMTNYWKKSTMTEADRSAYHRAS